VPAYRCGDALGVYPINSPALVRQVTIASRLNSEEIVTIHGGIRKMLFAALSEDCCLRSGSDAFSGAGNVDRDGDLLDVIQHGREIFQWLQDGAYFYVCGDAKSMAASVQTALQQIIATHGHMSPDAALEHVKVLQKQQRIQRDVY
jgi:sulfite reductase alpha subunit-like flavoprotein